MKITAYAEVGLYGWQCLKMVLENTAPVHDAALKAVDPLTEEETEVKVVLTAEEGTQVLVPEKPFSWKTDFTLTLDGSEYHKADVAETVDPGLARFESVVREDLWYRLYIPKMEGPRPLILFLHGGGESGTDNHQQLTNNFGPIHLSEAYPDCFVMAPQTPVDPRKKLAEPNGNNKTGYANRKMFGFTREYLKLLTDEIRRMIAEGKVDEHRVYITGAARGGGASLLALDVDKTLFAGCAPISPRITPEVYEAFHTRTDIPIWISVPYVDETLDRNKYIVDAVMELKDAGHRDVHLTIYSPEKLAEYGIGAGQDKPLERKLKENHRCWVLTYIGEEGIMDWLVSRKK